MNSKEALENWYNTQSPRTKAYEYEQHYRLIKKDLEVLEFIKTHYKMNGFHELIPLYLTGSDDERFIKLKRWLENEK